MFNFFLRLYYFLFGRKIFYPLNKFLFNLSLRGIGIDNYQSDILSGEDHFLSKIVKNRGEIVVYDVGANIGNYSKKILKYNPKAKIFAFEPHPKNFIQLRENLSGYPVNLFNVGISDVPGKLKLYDYQNRDGSSHASLYRDVIEKFHDEKSIEHEVEIKTLSDISREKSLEKIDLLKIDTEGNELKVLQGFKDYIDSNKINVIQFEFNSMNIVSKVFFKDFWDLLPNYRFYRMLQDGIIPVDRYSPYLCEIFVYQNIVAILKTK